jgi:signal transduction histidine kinase
MLSSANSLNRVLSDVLDLSRAESGRIEIRDEPFDVSELVREVGVFFASQARDKGLDFAVAFDDAVEARVLGDRDRLHQVLTNLIGNGLKFTKSGRISLTAKAAFADGERCLRLEVRDTGIGFDPRETERLFGRFEQADPSITRAHGGSGLGLAICRELVELMGGRIGASSTPGEGSTFTVDLPMRFAPVHPAPDPGFTEEPAPVC